MANHYNLYESLGLNPSDSTEQLHEAITTKLQALHDAGTPVNSGEVQEALTALEVLGADHRRSIYDARLADDTAADITIPMLRELAAHPAPASDADSFPTQQMGVVQSPAGQAEPSGAQPFPLANAYVAPSASPTPSGPELNSQPGQQQQWQQSAAPQPALMPQAHLTTTVTTPAPELAAEANLGAMWRRLPTLAKVFVSLLGVVAASGVIGSINTIFAGYSALSAIADLDSLDDSLSSLFSGLGATMGALATMVMLPLTWIISYILVAVSSLWMYLTLQGRRSAAPAFFTLSVVPLALPMFALSISMLDYATGVVMFLISIVLIATLVLVWLPEMQAWFRGQILVKTTQPNPHVAPQQFSTPQAPQSTDSSHPFSGQ